MQITIRGNMKTKAADAVQDCVFTAIRAGDELITDIRALDESCICYTAIRSAEPNGDSAVFEISDSFCLTLAKLIEKYICTAAAELADNDMEWLCEIMSFYHQLKKAGNADVQRDYETEEKMTSMTAPEEQYFEDVSF